MCIRDSSTFIAQNYGAKKEDRIRAGIKSAVGAAAVFCLLISTLVFLFARPLLLIFIRPEESEILSIGVEYLRIEGAFYCGIGALFLLFGLYRAIQKPGMSLVLTVISLGTRVAVSYTHLDVYKRQALSSTAAPIKCRTPNSICSDGITSIVTAVSRNPQPNVTAPRRTACFP